MADPKGISHCEDILVHTLLDWGITSGVAGALALGGVWGGWLFDATTGSYVYCRPVKVNDLIARNFDRMCVDAVWVAGAEPVDPPKYVYWDLTYGVRGDGETLGFDYDPYQQAQVDALDFTNLVKKRTRFDLQDVFQGNEGKDLAMTIGRDGAAVEDTYGGNIMIIGAYLMIKGQGE